MGRAPCCDKNISLKKGPWTPEEDQKLIDYIQKNGHGSWKTLPKNAGLERCGKSCRLRWANYLRPDIKRGRLSFEEEETIVQLHSVLGNKWSAIAAELPGRTDNEIKNYWNTHIRKRLLRMGIDPVTHRPRLGHLLDFDFSSVLGSPLCNTSQLDHSRLLDIEPLVNSQILKLALNILSTSPVPQIDQYSNPVADFLEQNQVLPDNGPLHLSNATFLQTTSRVSNLDQKQYFLDVNSQLLQPNNSDQLNPIDLAGGQIAQPNLWQRNDSNFDHSNFIPLTGDQPIINTFSGASNYRQLIPSSSHQDFSVPLVASMPTITSSTRTLNSSPTSINIGSGSTAPSSTCINGSYTEGERDSGCNTVLSFKIPGLFDHDEFIRGYLNSNLEVGSFFT